MGLFPCFYTPRALELHYKDANCENVQKWIIDRLRNYKYIAFLPEPLHCSFIFTFFFIVFNIFVKVVFRNVKDVT